MRNVDLKTVLLMGCLALMAGGCAKNVFLNPNANLKDAKRIAVVPGKDTHLYSVVAAMWEADLLTLGYDVLDRNSIQTQIKEASLTASGATQEDTGAKIGKLLALDAILYLDETPAAYGLNGKGHMVDVMTGRIICTVTLDYQDILAKVMRKALKKAGWAHFYRSYGAGGNSGPLLVRNPKFDQKSIKKVAISPSSKYDLTNQLIEAGYDPIERKAFENILAEQKLASSGIMSQDEMEKIGKLYGIDGMVYSDAAEIPEYGKFYYAKMVQMETGLVVWEVARLGTFLEDFEITTRLIKKAMLGKQE